MRGRLEIARESPLARRVVLVAAWALVGAFATLVLTVLASLLAGQKLVVIGSDSQRPSLSDGDVVIERQVHPAEVEVDQIITFSAPGTGSQLTHRVVAVHAKGDRTTLLTKGDSSPTYERFTLPATGEVGVVIRRIPLAGRISDILGGPLALIVLPLALLAVAGAFEVSRRRLRPGM